MTIVRVDPFVRSFGRCGTLLVPIHALRSALRVVEQVFPTLLEEQDFLGKPERWSKMLALAPAKARTSLHDEWMEDADKSSLHRWRRLKNDLSKVCSARALWYRILLI